MTYRRPAAVLMFAVALLATAATSPAPPRDVSGSDHATLAFTRSTPTVTVTVDAHIGSGSAQPQTTSAWVRFEFSDLPITVEVRSADGTEVPVSGHHAIPGQPTTDGVQFQPFAYCPAQSDCDATFILAFTPTQPMSVPVGWTFTVLATYGDYAPADATVTARIER